MFRSHQRIDEMEKELSNAYIRTTLGWIVECEIWTEYANGDFTNFLMQKQ